MTDFPPITPAPEAGKPPLPAGAQLIFAQSRHMEKAGVPAALTTLYWEVQGAMDEAAMCRAMDTLARSRDYLHLGLAAEGGQGVLREAEPDPVRVEALDPEKLAEVMAAWAKTPPGPPSSAACTLRLLKLGEARWAIGLSGPHDLLDIWTINQTLTSLAGLYNAAIEGNPLPLEQAPGFRDFSAWYDRLITSGRLAGSRDFWQSLLEGTSPVFTAPPGPETAFDHPMDAIHSALPLDPDLCRAFEAKTRAAGASVFEGYFTLFNITLARLTGRKNLLSAFVASLRRVSGIGNVEGCLLNRFYIPVRMDRVPDAATVAGDFPILLDQVSGTLRSAKTHCLWPAWKDVDPEATGYPGLFFHYVPPDSGQMPRFTGLSVSPFTLVTPAHWPHPMAFQVTADPKHPMLFAIGQSGFCSRDWLSVLQKTFTEVMAEI